MKKRTIKRDTENGEFHCGNCGEEFSIAESDSFQGQPMCNACASDLRDQYERAWVKLMAE